MRTTSSLTESEKNQIYALKQVGKSQRDIAKLIGRSRGAVQGFLRRNSNPIKPKGKGRKNIIKGRDIRRIKNFLRKNPMSNSSDILKNTSITASRWTVNRILKRYGYSWKKAKAIPRWKPIHLSNRLNFARLHQTWRSEWRSVIFTDEKKFNLDGPDTQKYYWHALGSEIRNFSRRQCGGKSLMVWGGFSYGGKLPLQILNGKINAEKYCSTLEAADLIDQGSLIAGDNFFFMQDRAPIHQV